MHISYFQHLCFKPVFIVAFLWATLVFCQPASADVACPPTHNNQITPYLGTWQGQVGSSPIELHLEPHAEDAQRTQGYYINTSAPQTQIMVVGEQVEGVFEVEESSNGADISGLWELFFPQYAPRVNDCYLTLEGKWLDNNFQNPQTITLRREPLSW